MSAGGESSAATTASQVGLYSLGNVLHYTHAHVRLRRPSRSWAGFKERLPVGLGDLWRIGAPPNLKPTHVFVALSNVHPWYKLYIIRFTREVPYARNKLGRSPTVVSRTSLHNVETHPLGPAWSGIQSSQQTDKAPWSTLDSPH